VNTLAISEVTRSLILYGLDAAPGKFKSRSELVFSVALRLIHAGCNDATVASVLLDPRHAVSEKPSEQGSKWLVTDIGRIREKVRAGELTLGRGCGEREAASRVIEVEIG
jgi:hypothetical protein